MRHLNESISVGKRMGFPYHPDLHVDQLKDYLDKHGYVEKPAYLRGSLMSDYHKADYMGQNCYFTYRDAYSMFIVVSSEEEPNRVIEFWLAPYGFISYVGEVDKNGKCKGFYDIKKQHSDFLALTKEFLRIK